MSQNLCYVVPEFDHRLHIDFTKREKVPRDFELTAEQKQFFIDKAEADFLEQRLLFEQEYEGMYAAMIQAFPIDKYFAEEFGE